MKNGGAAAPIRQRRLRGDDIVDGVAQHRHGRAPPTCRSDPIKRVRPIADPLDGDMAARQRGRIDGLLAQAVTTRERHQGIRRMRYRRCRGVYTPAPGVDERLPLTGGQRGGKNDRRAAGRRVKLQQPRQLLADIGVIAMGLINDQDAPGKRMLPQGEELLGQDAQKRLVDGAGPDLGEQRAPPVIGDPGGAGCGHRLVPRVGVGPTRQPHLCEALGEIPTPVQQGERRARLRREQPSMRIMQTREHRVRRRHGRQREIDSFPFPGQHHAMGQHNCGLGLASACGLLDDHQRRPIRQADRLGRALHRSRRDHVEQTRHAPGG